MQEQRGQHRLPRFRDQNIKGFVGTHYAYNYTRIAQMSSWNGMKNSPR